MQPPIAIIGIGQLGGVFARAFLRAGHPVYPLTRGMALNQTLEQIPAPILTLVAVGEKDLPAVLQELSPAKRSSLGLLQNELLPGTWQSNGVIDPTVISVWFEKKKGMDVKVLRPSPLFGPQAALMAAALEGIGISCRQMASSGELLLELVVKNVFVYMINICGLRTGGNPLRKLVVLCPESAGGAAEIIDLQEAITKTTFSRSTLMDSVVEGIAGDPEHKCMGRSAPARLTRFLSMADEAGITADTIREIQADLNRESK